MAKAKKKAAAKPAKAAKKSGAPGAIRLAVLLLLGCAGVYASASLIFVMCMMPTFVAALIDKQPQKTLWMTVGAMNLAGTIPAWFHLWDMGNNITDSLRVVENPGILLMAYGGAAAGWIIHMNVTPLVAAIVVRRNEARVRDIEKRQKELIRKWGEDIARMG